jgi:hypothetical protein
VQLSSVGIGSGKVKGKLQVELDSTVEKIECKLSYLIDGGSHYLPFRMNYTGELESLRAEMVEGGNIPREAAEILRKLVFKALEDKVSKAVKERLAKEKISRRNILPETRALEPGLSRQDRISRYNSEKQRARKRKVGSVTSTQKEEFIEEQVAKEERAQMEIKIIGLEYENVEDILVRSGIEDLDPHWVIKKLRQYAEVAAQGKKMLGKRVVLTNNFGINLRQINWMIENNRAIRAYLEDVGSGEFILRGILAKKGESMQNRYILNLMHEIRDKRLKGSN